MTRAADIDIGWVAQRRGANMSWAAIANMAGCSEADLRRHYDANAASAGWLRRAVNPRETVRTALRARGFTPDEALILARLWLANGARCKSAELAAGITGGEAAREICSEAKRRAFNQGVRFEIGPGGYALTPGGIQTISGWAGLRGRP